MPDLPSLVPSAPLASRRARLRPMTMADVPAVAAIRTLPKAHAYLSHGALSQEQLDARMRLRVARMTMRSDQESSVHFVIESREDGATIGDCGVRITPMWTKDEVPTEHVEAVITYVLAPQVSGRGIGTEVVGLLTDHAFSEPRVHRVRADVFAPNTASRTVLQRNHFRQEALFVENGVIDGEFVDSCAMPCCVAKGSHIVRTGEISASRECDPTPQNKRTIYPSRMRKQTAKTALPQPFRTTTTARRAIN